MRTQPDIRQVTENQVEAWSSTPHRIYIDDGVEIAYREVGQGPPIILIHGWPLTGATYRGLALHLAPDFRCILPDSPGLGDSQVEPGVPLDARAQAGYFQVFTDRLGLNRFSMLAHDTGAITARILAANRPDCVDKLVLFNTEMPGHRPPWFSWLVHTLRLPGARWLFRRLLRWPTILWSNAGLGSCYADLSSFKEELQESFVRPWLENDQRWAGSMAYAEHFRWSLVDSLKEIHPMIQARVLLVWGAADPLFDVDHARRMVEDFPNCEGLHVLEKAKLCAYDEFAAEVSERIRAFLKS